MKEENDIPYLLDFARNIGIPQKWIGRRLGYGITTLTKWAMDYVKPREYEDVKRRIVSIIEEKLNSDLDEWEEYKERQEEDETDMGNNQE